VSRIWYLREERNLDIRLSSLAAGGSTFLGRQIMLDPRRMNIALRPCIVLATCRWFMCEIMLGIWPAPHRIIGCRIRCSTMLRFLISLSGAGLFGAPPKDYQPLSMQSMHRPVAVTPSTATPPCMRRAACLGGVFSKIGPGDPQHSDWECSSSWKESAIWEPNGRGG
jgi:hypothetical protein